MIDVLKTLTMVVYEEVVDKADTDGDGRITLIDVLKILKRSVY